MKGERIEQVNQHQILGLIFDGRMTWNGHILYAKQKIHQMVVLSTIRYGEEAYGSGNLNQRTTEE
jgi:hypothetical protein